MALFEQLLRYGSLLGRGPSSDPLEQRDPGFIEAERGGLERLLDAWYTPEVLGLENMLEGRMLAVGAHNGGMQSPDMFITMVAFWKRFGVLRESYGLAHDVVFRLPGIGRYIAKMGAVPAHTAHAETLLGRDAAVLVYPGGDVDAFKPYARRHVIEFGGRKGFARIAIRTGAPIVPIVSVGAHEGFHLLTDGRAFANKSGLKRWTRVEVFPIGLALPFGLYVSALQPYLPLPTRVRVQILPPIELGLPPSAAEDPAAVDAAGERVRATMQAGLDALVAQGDFGRKARLERLGLALGSTAG
jgi:1-acyl-sn-glycerol-3-phosphate acyltransferase